MPHDYFEKGGQPTDMYNEGHEDQADGYDEGTQQKYWNEELQSWEVPDGDAGEAEEIGQLASRYNRGCTRVLFH